MGLKKIFGKKISGDKTEIKKFFETHNNLKQLTDPEKENLAGLCTLRLLAPEEVVFKEGEVGEEMCLLKKGAIKIYKTGYLGERMLTLVSVGEFFGEMSLLDNSPRSANAKATTDSEIVVITTNNFEQLKNTYPKAAVKIMDILLKLYTKRLRETTFRAFG